MGNIIAINNEESKTNIQTKKDQIHSVVPSPIKTSSEEEKSLKK